MLHTLACSLLVAAATWSAAPAAAEETIVIPFELEADGTVPFVDTSAVEVFPVEVDSPGRTLLGLSAGAATSTRAEDGRGTSATASTKPIFTSKHTTSSSSVKCTASASSYSFADSKNAYVSSIAYAVKEGCTGKITYQKFKKIRTQIKKRSGYAVALAVAEAATKCKSKGNAAGCAAAKAASRAWATAVFSANAYAYANALNKCKHCGDKYQLAKAETYGFAEEFDKVVAKVEAKAESSTCVSGNAEAGNSVYASCYQAVFADVISRSVAKAIIRGQCGYYGSNQLDADARIAAVATIDKYEIVQC